MPRSSFQGSSCIIYNDATSWSSAARMKFVSIQTTLDSTLINVTKPTAHFQPCVAGVVTQCAQWWHPPTLQTQVAENEFVSQIQKFPVRWHLGTEIHQLDETPSKKTKIALLQNDICQNKNKQCNKKIMVITKMIKQIIVILIMIIIMFTKMDGN